MWKLRALFIIVVVAILSQTSFAQFPAQNPDALMFPQFATGAGMQWELTLVNPSDAKLTATIQLYGDTGQRFSNDPLDGYQLTVPGHGSTVFGSLAQQPIEVGWMVVVAQTYTDGWGQLFVLNGILRLYIPGAGWSAIAPYNLGTDFLLPVRTISPIRTGIAIANPCQNSEVVSITARRSDGTSVGTISLSLGAAAHISKFIDELFGGLGANFLGTAEISTPIPSGYNNSAPPCAEMAIAGFDLGNGLGQFIVLPVTPIPGP